MFIARLYLAWAIALPSDRLNEPATTDRHTSSHHRHHRSGQLPISMLFLLLPLSLPLMSRPIYTSLHHPYVYALLETCSQSCACTTSYRPSTPTGESIRVDRSSSVLLFTLRNFNEMQHFPNAVHAFFYLKTRVVDCSRERY